MRTLLISAYACEPLKGSEQGVGWNWVLQLARKNKLHVITRANNQSVIEAHLPADVTANITFHYYDTHRFFRALKKRAKGLYLYYFFWQIGIISIIHKILKSTEVDYSIHLTMGSLWMPTFLPFFKGPFIWGPLGGGEGIPKNFLSSLELKQRIVQSFRFVLKYLIYLKPLLLISLIKARKIIVRTNNTYDFIPAGFQHKATVFLETAMEEQVLAFKRTDIKEKQIKLIITGRLVPFKNVISAIKALESIPENYSVLLTIVGNGSEKKKIEDYINEKNLNYRIQLFSELPRESILHMLVESDIYLFSSLREGGSWALMEAMAVGLPVVCLKWSGMEIITDDSCALRLPVSNPKQMPKDMAAAICKLIENPELRLKMGMAGRERIKNVFNWEAKGEFMEQLLNELDSQKSI
jgi:glycosyltransferase involved in cell wall biosynthesis